MFGGIDPKKMASMMKQMGIAQEEVAADRVIIEKSNGEGRIIIDNPHIVKIKMQGQENFQISGDVKEETGEEENEEDKLESDIQAIVEQTGADKEVVAIELERNNGDIAETIIALSDKGKKK